MLLSTLLLSLPQPARTPPARTAISASAASSPRTRRPERTLFICSPLLVGFAGESTQTGWAARIHDDHGCEDVAALGHSRHACCAQPILSRGGPPRHFSHRR